MDTLAHHTLARSEEAGCASTVLRGLADFAERLTTVRDDASIFAAFAETVRKEGAAGVLIEFAEALGAGRETRWTNLSPDRQALFHSSKAVDAMVGLVGVSRRAVVVAWSVVPQPNRYHFGTPETRELLARAGIASGLFARLSLPSGRVGFAHVLGNGELSARSPELSRDLFQVAAINALLAADRNPVLPADVSLTRRERETLLLSARGFRVRQIADVLGIAERTAKFHLHGARRKLNARTMGEAIAQMNAGKDKSIEKVL